MKTMIVAIAMLLTMSVAGQPTQAQAPATPPGQVMPHPPLQRLRAALANGQVVELDGWIGPSGAIFYNESEQRPGWNQPAASPSSNTGHMPMTGATVGAGGQVNYGLDLGHMNNEPKKMMMTNDQEFNAGEGRMKPPATPPAVAAEFGPIALIGAAGLIVLYARTKAR
jgi:hypothetical protein